MTRRRQRSPKHRKGMEAKKWRRTADNLLFWTHAALEAVAMASNGFYFLGTLCVSIIHVCGPLAVAYNMAVVSWGATASIPVLVSLLWGASRAGEQDGPRRGCRRRKGMNQ
jgi:hypothetical protein